MALVKADISLAVNAHFHLILRFYLNGKPWTPIYWAAYHGHTEIVKILAPLTENPNAPNREGETPMDIAENEEIKEILASFKTS